MKHEKSCGCIIIEENKVLLVRQNNGVWGFPKGHVEKNESEVETATREVKEETAIDVSVDKKKRYTMNYLTDRGASKEVVFFLAKKVSGELKPQESEISDIQWLDFKNAIRRLSYNNTKCLFKKFLNDNNLI